MITIQSLAPMRINSTVLAVKSVNFGAGIISETDKHNGNLYGTLVRVSGAEPVITAQVPFAAAYSLIGFGSLAVTTLEVWLATFASYERQTTGNKWDLSSGATGVAVISGISVDQDGLVLAEITITPLSADGDVHPLQPGSGTLPTLAGQPALHTLGAAVVNGTGIDGMDSFSGDLGQQVQTYRGDGQRYATVAGRLGGMPRLTANLRAPTDTLAAVGLLGANISSSVIFYFRSYNPTTGEVAVSGGTGISITATSGRIAWGSLSVEQLGIGSIDIVVDALSANSTHPLAVSLSATLP
jgi:hypothetical protein